MYEELVKMEMRTGNLWKSILKYSIPLMFTNLLQIFFNLADVAVVGKFAGPISLGAVGSTTILVTLTTGWLIGMSNGVNALVALFTGAEEKKKLKTCVSTGFILCLSIGIGVLAIGEIASAPVLRLLGTKDELIDQALRYFRIYMLGSPALAVFNYGNAVLSATGDTERPLKYLTVAGIINVCLNLLFVIGCGMEAEGVGLASVIAQYVSAVCILAYLFKSGESFGLSLLELGIDRSMTIRILRIGVPSAVQYSLFAVANLFVQAAVNSFDHVTVEGNSAAANADNIVYDMMAAFYTACTSFIAQNYGAGKYDRIRKTYFITTLYSMGIAIFIGALLVVFGNQFLLVFTSDEAVIERGMVKLMIMSCSYWISAFMDNATAASRGLGKTVWPTVFVILGTVVFRIVWIYTIFAAIHTLESLYILYAFAWTFTAIFGNIYFFRQLKKIQKKQFAI